MGIFGVLGPIFRVGWWVGTSHYLGPFFSVFMVKLWYQENIRSGSETFILSTPIIPPPYYQSLFLGHPVYWTFNGWPENSLLAQRVQSCSKQLCSQPDEKHYLYTEQSSESVLSLVSGTKILVKIAMTRQTTEWPKKRAAKPSSWGSIATKPKQTRRLLSTTSLLP